MPITEPAAIDAYDDEAFMKNMLCRFWTDLSLFWKTYVLALILAASVVMIGEGAEGLAKTFIRLTNFSIKSNIREAVLWLIAIMASSLLGSLIISRIITGALIRIQPVVEQFSSGDLDSRISGAEAGRGDEIGSLSRSFNQMADNVSRLLEIERNLMRDISHELRSPLARMKMALALLKQDAGPSEAVEPHLQQLERDIGRMDSMLGQILDRARLETADGAGGGKAGFDFVPLVKGSIEEQRAGASKEKSIVYKGLEAAPYFGNAALMRRAVDNLIRNALNYTAKGSAVEVGLQVKNDVLILEVKDQGPGVPDDQLEDIFRPFYRVDSARARSCGGFGLGLAIARQAAQLHGGQVMAANIVTEKPNKDGAAAAPHPSRLGLKVTLILPFAKSAEGLAP